MTLSPFRVRALIRKPVDRLARKNSAGSAANCAVAIKALNADRCLSFTYEGLARIVEVHTVGVTTAGRPAMCAYQVDGSSNSGPVPDWRMFCFDECFDVTITERSSSAPRSEHKRGAKQFRSIDREV